MQCTASDGPDDKLFVSAATPHLSIETVNCFELEIRVPISSPRPRNR